MDIYLLQSQLHLNAQAIREAEWVANSCKEVMKTCVEDEQYEDAKSYQKEYRFFKNRLRSLVALQKALKKDKREKVAMWRFQRDVEAVKQALSNN